MPTRVYEAHHWLGKKNGAHDLSENPTSRFCVSEVEASYSMKKVKFAETLEDVRNRFVIDESPGSDVWVGDVVSVKAGFSFLEGDPQTGSVRGGETRLAFSAHK